MSDASATPLPPLAPPDRGPVAAILWACFLGSSWTWIIGMLFPILLVRDYGLGGWLVFAVPNVLGAAAMGFVLSTPETSQRVLARHRAAAVRFSEVTVAYHVFVVGWFYLRLFGGFGVLATAAMALLVFVLAGRRGPVLAVTAVVTVISLAMLAAWLATQGLGDAPLGLTPTRLTSLDLLMFTPAAIAGFALSPYLDLTFHRAREATEPGTGRVAFALGFGGVFLAMIVFSLLYAEPLRGLFEPGGGVTLPAPAGIILAVHMTLQAGLTIGLHLREIGDRRGHAGLHRAAGFAIAAGALAYWAVSEPSRVLDVGLGVGEAVYRGFLLLYGLVFPAYVWLCMWPTRRPIAERPKLVIFGAATLAALPMGYLGFVAGDVYWIPFSLALLLLARFILVCLPAGEKEVSSF